MVFGTIIAATPYAAIDRSGKPGDIEVVK